jgi:hypothetical protein
MQHPHTLRLYRRDIDALAYKDRHAGEGDYSRLVTAPTVVVDADTGEPVIVYLAPIAANTRLLAALLWDTDIPEQDRMSGMKSQWVNFGYRQRNPVRNPNCDVAKLASEHQRVHAELARLAPVVAAYYRQYGPAVYQQHQAEVAAVFPDWKLEDTPFTAGIVNRDGWLPYHYDGGNVKGVWSGMLGLRRDMTGGVLSIPVYDLALDVADKSLTLFDGQGLLHGVTPFSKASPYGYRFTVVYYSRERMWECLPPGEEAKRSRR